MRAWFGPDLGEEAEDPGAGGRRLAGAPLALRLLLVHPPGAGTGGEAGRAGGH